MFQHPWGTDIHAIVHHTEGHSLTRRVMETRRTVGERPWFLQSTQLLEIAWEREITEADIDREV